MTARLAVAITAALISAANLAALFWFDTPWLIADSISLITGAIVARQVTRLMKEKRHGQHWRTEEDPSDPQARYDALVAQYKSSKANIASHSSSSFPYSSSSSRSGVTRVEDPADEIERVESDMPILAHRSARLCLGGTSQHFGSVVQEGGRFGVDAEASCSVAWRYMAMGISSHSNHPRARPHKAPSFSCECGFYALPTDLAPTYENADYVTLMVELSGTVIEHEKGYRAEHQRVVECQMPPCVYCGAEADLLVVKSFMMEQATCAAHKPVAEPGAVYLDITDLAALLPVPVTRAGRRTEGKG